MVTINIYKYTCASKKETKEWEKQTGFNCTCVARRFA